MVKIGKGAVMVKKILGRVLVVVPALAIQVLWIVLLVKGVNWIADDYLVDVLNVLFRILAVIFVISIVNRRDESAYKILWVIVIVALPILGSIMYLFLGNKRTGAHLDRKIRRAEEALDRRAFYKNENIVSEIEKDDEHVAQIISHLSEDTNFPVLPNESVKYYPWGQDVFADMREDLKKAKKYVYIEYFIIERGLFWDTLTDILAEKAKEGVDVRVIYDDLGSIGTYSVKDAKELKDRGIKCVPFNPLLFVRTQLNNRTHRKIMVIDGEVAYSGGINLADEYINEIHPYGVWKDIGFRMTGKAVQSYQFMFLEFWNAIVPIDEIIIPEIPKIVDKPASIDMSNMDGFIWPYYDSPEREEHTSNALFTEMLSMATEYIWFYTPYLMLGDTLFDAFIRAARRGVDVRVIVPGTSDSKMVQQVAKTYYRDLVAAGVKIYEYTPGFVHAKAMICDDKVAGVGTVNLDYRSLFLHYECFSVFYKSYLIDELKKDFLATQEECELKTLESIPNGVLTRFLNGVLRLIAPLM